MSDGKVRTDGSLLSRGDQMLFRVESLMNLIGGLVILGVMFLAVANIVGRYFGYPVPGYIDWMEQGVPAIAIFGMVYCQRLGGHIRMDIVVNTLKGRLLWFAELIGVLLILGIALVLAYGSFDHAERAFRLGDSTVDINLQTWPIKMLFPVMFILLALRLLLQVYGYLRAIRTGEEEPVAVPLIESAAEQAKAEAETVSGLEGDNETGSIGNNAGGNSVGGNGTGS